MKLSNKVAVVSGGASGLGEATVERLLDGGARVAILDRNADLGRALADRHRGKAIFMSIILAASLLPVPVLMVAGVFMAPDVALPERLVRLAPRRDCRNRQGARVDTSRLAG